MMINILEVNEDFKIEEIKYHRNYQLIILLLQNEHCSFQSFNDKHNNTLLHQLIQYGQIEEVIIIANKYKQYINTPNDLGQTPIMLASFLGYIKIVRIMILCGADIQVSDKNSFTSLLYSIKGNHTYLAIYLIGKGANVQCVDKNGCNVVHWSAHNDNIYLLKIFVKHLGLKCNEQDFRRLTPLQRAINNYSYESAIFLSEFVSYDKSTIKSKYLISKLFKQQKQLGFIKYINFILSVLLNVYVLYYFKQMEDELILEHLQKIIIFCQICYLYLQPQAQIAQDYLFRLNQRQKTNGTIKENDEEDEETNVYLEIDGPEVPLIKNEMPTNNSKFQKTFVDIHNILIELFIFKLYYLFFRQRSKCRFASRLVVF